MAGERALGLFSSVAPGTIEARVRLPRGLWPSLLNFVVPPRCGGCGERGAWLCAGCQASLVRIGPAACRRCGASLERGTICPACRREPPRLDGLRACVRFDGAGRQIVHTLKYRGARVLAPVMAVLLAEALAGERGVLVPVPLHPDRERARGFNQAVLLAQALAARHDPPLPVERTVLRRTRPTPPQTHLDRAARRENVRGAFTCRDGSLAGEAVILVDDVATTGSTLEACADALREAGVRHVVGLVFARA